MPKISRVIRSFLKLGCIGFGGGSALIPIIEEELVGKWKWKTEDDYTRDTIIANITPGALPVKLSALWSAPFSLVSAFTFSFPGVMLLLSLLTCFSIIGENAVQYIEFASIGIYAFIILLLSQYIQKVMHTGRQGKMFSRFWLITAVSFLLVGGKSIRFLISTLFGFEPTILGIPIFAVRALDLMILSFFIIMFSGKSKIKFYVSLPFCLFYAICAGKAQLLQIDIVIPGFFMFIMTIISILLENRKRHRANKYRPQIDFSPMKNILLFAGLAAAVSVTTFFVVRQYATPEGTSYWGYVLNVGISTVTSFGGGEAYLVVADNFFAQTGYIDPSVFYSQVVAVSNALPGSILIHLASGVGYIYGVNLGGIGVGWLMAMVGIVLAVGVSAIGALIMLIGFETLKDAERLMLLKKYILPVVCGMLISTILSIVYEALKITTYKVHLPASAGLGFMAALFAAMLLLHKRYHWNDLIILITGGGFSLLVLYCFSL